MPAGTGTGNTQPAAGGDPLDIPHDISLCSDPPTAGGFDSHFTGRLLDLVIWNRSLTASAIRTLFLQVPLPSLTTFIFVGLRLCLVEALGELSKSAIEVM